MEAEEKRIESRYVDGGSALTTLIQRDAVKVYWLTVFPETVATIGVIKIYDGFDTGGKLKWQLETGVVGHFVFLPPIPCEQGLFISSDANVGGYAVGYRPVKWEAPVK